ncbi:MAG TPA: UdgX family uracil-DNA binding protein [Gemmatimonadaceae bacterium]|nr:UdgX family uracil-DNA binding protein [Gemmatimonadaceae bacterium]
MPRAASSRTTPQKRASVTGSAADFLPPRLSLPALRRAAAGCRGCHLWRVGTQTVFGEGARSATIMFVGEQPGDREDLAGHPFVGPSGRLLDSALERAGLDRRDAYVTNAVKHFKWVPDPGGKRRIHKTPSSSEIGACHPWLDAELTVVKPRVVIALGATAAKSLFGNAFRVTTQRGRVVDTPLAEAGFATVHPSSVLRTPSARRAEAEGEFVSDLKKVARWLEKHPD